MWSFISSDLPDYFGVCISQIPHSFSLYLCNEALKTFANLHQLPLCYSYFRYFSFTGIQLFHFNLSYRLERRKCFLAKSNATKKWDGREKPPKATYTMLNSVWRITSISPAKNNSQNSIDHSELNVSRDDMRQGHAGLFAAHNSILS